MTRFHLATLGCKVNQYESQALREAWIAQGCAETADPAGADVVVVNSCAVTAGALADLRQLVARVRRANPAVRVVVTGCAAQAVRAEVAAIAGVDCIVPQAEKATLLAGLPLGDLRALSGEPARAAAIDAAGSAAEPDAAAKEISISVEGKTGPTFPKPARAAASGAAGSAANPDAAAFEGAKSSTGSDEPASDSEAAPDTTGSSSRRDSSSNPRRSELRPEQETSSPRTAGHSADRGANLPPSAAPHSARSGRGRRPYPAFAVTASPRARAQVKVQDGCSHGCAYCIVPLARGGPASRAPEAVLAECRRLLAGGWQELVLSGINLRQYRAEKRNFWGLLRFLEEHLAPEWAGRARLRLSSLDPGQLGAEALDSLAASRLACPHLHLSIQAGSPGVLARMNRGHYGPQDILDFLAALLPAWPRFGLGADLLTGFPGESAAEFEETRALVAALPLTYAHVFPYSPRPGAPAADLPGQLSPEVKKVRAATLRQLAGRKKAAFLGELAGLAELAMVLEDAATGRGVSEYGTDCRLTPVPAKAAVRAILRVRPAGLAQSGLRVAPAGDVVRAQGGRAKAPAGTAQPRGGRAEARRP